MKESVDSPYLSIRANLSFYNYCVVVMHIEHGGVSFWWYLSEAVFELTRASVLVGDTGKNMERIGVKTLTELDREIRLRVPDKFLSAKGWL